LGRLDHAPHPGSHETLSDTNTTNSASSSRPSSPISTNPISRSSSPARSASSGPDSKPRDQVPINQQAQTIGQWEEAVKGTGFGPVTVPATALEEAILRRASIQSVLAGLEPGLT
jgi:hypothetical protein